MHRSRRFAAFIAALLAAEPAWAYRPFDSTDADVAKRGEVELELGPVGYLREDRRNFVAPGEVINVGMLEDWELVLQGREVAPSLSGEGSRLTVDDTGAFLKTVLREGCLQDRPGPSVATEVGALLPTVNGDPGAGFSADVIFSERVRFATLHLNVQGARTRAGNADAFLGLITEGPYTWAIRPVSELFFEREFDVHTTRSVLVGVIGRFSDDLSLDSGVRLAWIDGEEVVEVRGGLTWAFPL